MQDLKGNEFLYDCELNEARWQEAESAEPCDLYRKKTPQQRIAGGRAVLNKHEKMINDSTWRLSGQEKDERRRLMIRRLNDILSK